MGLLYRDKSADTSIVKNNVPGGHGSCFFNLFIKSSVFTKWAGINYRSWCKILSKSQETRSHHMLLV